MVVSCVTLAKCHLFKLLVAPSQWPPASGLCEASANACVPFSSAWHLGHARCCQPAWMWLWPQLVPGACLWHDGSGPGQGLHPRLQNTAVGLCAPCFCFQILWVSLDLLSLLSLFVSVSLCLFFFQPFLSLGAPGGSASISPSGAQSWDLKGGTVHVAGRGVVLGHLRGFSGRNTRILGKPRVWDNLEGSWNVGCGLGSGRLCAHGYKS